MATGLPLRNCQILNSQEICVKQSDKKVSESSSKEETAHPPNRLLEGGKFVLWVVVITMVLRVSVAEAYRVEMSSMENTLLPGDTILGNKFLYGARLPLIGLRLPPIRNPRPGDIIVLQHPVEIGQRLIKRVIAVEGQVIEIRDKQLYVDNQPVPLPDRGKFVDSRVLPRGVSNRDNFGPLTVPDKSLFVMGDNRDISLDSRGWGFVGRDKVLGLAIIILYSWDHDPTEPFWERIRWSRFGHIPN